MKSGYWVGKPLTRDFHATENVSPLIVMALWTGFGAGFGLRHFPRLAVKWQAEKRL
jgi:hypothetical protein